MDLTLLLTKFLIDTTPDVIELILLLKKKDGTVAIVPILDEADEQFEENIRKIEEWRGRLDEAHS